MSQDQVRVVVTGLGATTPVGGDVTSTWDALLAGRSGARVLEQDWAAELPVRIAGPAAVEPTEVIERVEARRLDRSAQLALVAAREAWRDAGLADGGLAEAGVDTERLGVVIATGIGGVSTLIANYDALKERGPRRVSPHAVPMLMPNSSAAWIGLEFGARAGVHTPVSACASGVEAISYGLDMIRLGRADVVVVGGTEAAIHPLPLAAFASMMALSKRNDDPERASRPWDTERDGFVLGEGAGVLVLERADVAERRGAQVYCEVAGAGVSADAHHIAQPEPEGLGATRAMQLALTNSGLKPGDVLHINAHATSTPQGDVAETQAIRAALGEAAADIAVTSTKSMIGHLLGAAGAVESIVTALTLHHRLIPPTINVDNLDENVDLDIVRDQPRKLSDGPAAALSNSFGFGGHNVALALRSV